ncbi:MAG: metallophosphoesterase [Cytophagales bacterium]|nr:metallophosphoesterase [Cytophagales bacterium]
MAKRIVMISDTHGKHHDIQLPTGDILLHAGDVSRSGKKTQIQDFLLWFSKQDFTHKIFIAGNHDFFFEKASLEEIKSIIPENVIYLNDSGIEIEGIKIWGSPIQPWFYDWAFNRQRGEDIQKHWDLIPKDTQVLITHGPPLGILDRTIHGQEVGCENLTNTIQQLKKLKIHLFGHIHEGYGMKQQSNITFVNASVLDVSYQLGHEILTFDFN